jgi:hypothetical protein
MPLFCRTVSFDWISGRLKLSELPHIPQSVGGQFKSDGKDTWIRYRLGIKLAAFFLNWAEPICRFVFKCGPVLQDPDPQHWILPILPWKKVFIFFHNIS